MKHETTLEFTVNFESNPTVEEPMLFRPRKIGNRTSKISFTIVKKAEPNVVLATFVRGQQSIDMHVKRPDLMTHKDAEVTMQAIGTAMATELSRIREITPGDNSFQSTH